MHRFFTDFENIKDDNIIITGADVNHIKNVLRMKVGEHIMVSCGQKNEYKCEIISMDAERIIACIKDVFSDTAEMAAEIYLFQGLPKGDKMELIIQKAVELGAHGIIPVATKRSVVKLDEQRAAAKVRRWNMISESAAKQSGRAIIPEVSGVMDFGRALDFARTMDMVFIPYEEAGDMSFTRKVIEDAAQCQSIGVFIGPEGGFSPEEVELAKSTGAKAVTLGKRILRTETAGMTVLSILMYTLEK